MKANSPRLTGQLICKIAVRLTIIVFISSTGPNKKNNSTIFHHADDYMHLDAMHIPEAQSFPLMHKESALPEPVDIITFIAASLGPPVVD
jgi:hypothetical protein